MFIFIVSMGTQRGDSLSGDTDRNYMQLKRSQLDQLLVNVPSKQKHICMQHFNIISQCTPFPQPFFLCGNLRGIPETHTPRHPLPPHTHTCTNTHIPSRVKGLDSIKQGKWNTQLLCLPVLEAQYESTDGFHSMKWP